MRDVRSHIFRTMARTKPEPTPAPRLHRFKQKLREHNIPYSTGRDAHFRGDLAVVKIGTAWYLTDEELARFIEQCTERRAGPQHAG